MTRIEGTGIGAHLTDDKASIALFKPWQAFFEQAGAGELHLYRIY